MNLLTRTKLLAALGLSALMFVAGGASAATCTAVNAAADPDATLTNSVACGSGTLGTNDDATEVNLAENAAGFNLTWTQVDRDEAAGSGSTGGLLSSGVEGGASSGTWGIETTGLTYNAYLIVIKDGADVDPSWYWFIIDTAAGCPTPPSASYPAGTDYCGTWTMYGKNGSIKEISHLTLYGATVPSGTTPGTATPEPGSASLALLGLGLVGAGFIARRRKVAA
jgi:hypothetical protein